MTRATRTGGAGQQTSLIDQSTLNNFNISSLIDHSTLNNSLISWFLCRIVNFVAWAVGLGAIDRRVTTLQRPPQPTRIVLHT